ncbi:MAG TPA: PorP/SprF family type IX secretion system membrane protein [Saprospiraceae bacterium]|nr:PorP/SprF family type IX secretion system membrane protein [Saprospiraceae bacterium]
MKKTYPIRQMRYLLSAIVLCVGAGISAQDLHFSQFQNSPLNHNPALTGIFNGDERFAASYRRQWFSVPVEYMTFSGSYDRKFLRDGAKNFFSGGLLFDYDKAGKADLSTAYLGINGSYTIGLSESILLTGGATIGGGQRSSNVAGLRWGKQWNGRVYDPGLPTGEQDLDDTHFSFEIGGGLNLRLQKSARTRFDLGGGAFHLNQRNDSFYPTGNAKVPIRLALQGYGSLEVLPQLDLQANLLAQFSGPYQEIVLGGMLNIHVSTRKAREIQFGVGLGVRLDDALIPQVSLAYDGWRAGFSYDVNTSGFDVATNERGGPEFSLMYIITEVRALEQSKLCKIF